MAQISKSGIELGQTIQPEHLTRIIDALNETGSAEIIATGSFTGSFTGTGNFSSLSVNNLTVTETASVAYFEAIYETASIIYTSGSTKFGNSNDDIHQFTGSVYISGSISATSFTGSVSGTASLAQNAISASYAPNFANTDLTFTGDRAHNTNGNNYQLTFDNGVFAKGWQTLSETESSIGCGNQYVNANDTNIRFYTSGSERVKIDSNGNVGIGKSSPNATLDVNGNTVITGSMTVNGSTLPSLVVIGSGSNDATFMVSGSAGELFTVTDSLTGDLFTVADSNANSIFNVSSSYDITLGNPIATSLYATTTASLGVSPTTIYTIPTASYAGAWFEYTIRSGSNARAGQIMAIWNSTSVNFTETTTTDFGNTSGVNLGVLIIGDNMAFTGSATTAAWELRTIIRSI